MRIVHLTSVHPRHDVRIFLKQCRSLARRGHEVSLVVADGRGNERREGVHIVDVGAPTGRLSRMVTTARRVAERARTLEADIYHLHDPELIPGGLRLKRSGAAVVFDAHEDLPRQILAKAYIRPPLRRAVAVAAGGFERWACARLDGIVAATPHIGARFQGINPRTETVNNYPIVDELLEPVDQPGEDRRHVIYAGSITGVRGAREIVDAMAAVETDTRLLLAGSFAEPRLEDEVAARPGWARVEKLGHIDRRQLASALARSAAGLVTLHPVQAYRDALPVKMFEYMSAGLPVIASNFPAWREIVEERECGLCVDPLDPRQIAAAIDRLVGDPELAARMGRNGRALVLAERNWAVEEAKLARFYGMLAPRCGVAR